MAQGVQRYIFFLIPTLSLDMPQTRVAMGHALTAPINPSAEECLYEGQNE